MAALRAQWAAASVVLALLAATVQASQPDATTLNSPLSAAASAPQPSGVEKAGSGRTPYFCLCVSGGLS